MTIWYKETNKNLQKNKEKIAERRNEERTIPISYKLHAKIYTRTTEKRKKLLLQLITVKTNQNPIDMKNMCHILKKLIGPHTSSQTIPFQNTLGPNSRSENS